MQKTLLSSRNATGNSSLIDKHFSSADCTPFLKRNLIDPKHVREGAYVCSDLSVG